MYSLYFLDPLNNLKIGVFVYFTVTLQGHVQIKLLYVISIS